MSINAIDDLFQQQAILLNQIVAQLAEKDRMRTLLSVGIAVHAAKHVGSEALMLQEIFDKNFPGQPLPTPVDAATLAALQKAQSEQQR